MANTEFCRIHWIAEATEYKGRGANALPKRDAQQFCDALNRSWAGIITHWIEPVSGPTPDPERGEK